LAFHPDFPQIESGEIHEADPPSQGFRHPLDQIRRSRPQEQETSRIILAVNKHSQQLEQVGPPLHLVDDRPPG